MNERQRIVLEETVEEFGRKMLEIFKEEIYELKKDFMKALSEELKKLMKESEDMTKDLKKTITEAINEVVELKNEEMKKLMKKKNEEIKKMMKKNNKELKKLAKEKHEDLKKVTKEMNENMEKVTKEKNEELKKAMKEMNKKLEEIQEANKELIRGLRDISGDGSSTSTSTIGVVMVQEVVDEEDEKLENLRKDGGEEVKNTVKTALVDLNEFNPSGRNIVPELWNFEQERKATLKEGIAHMTKEIKTLKSKLP